ncbi:DUF3159 domain-containing protein [Pedococcus sp. 5OH_020]|uniref:DUF3159 domain-containing protein n=1 Tax=Pedococcus sp. 5OH_020 TaxID=2989814 RepID=UPI0022E9D389|nr:DUF3159 domain-containing protein [Pedococcus sp. 5OH_020]
MPTDPGTAATDPTDPGATTDLTGAQQTVEQVIRQRLSRALGGWRGSVETALPTVAFVLVWTWRKDVLTAVLATGAVAVVLAVVRLAQRQSLQFVLSAVVPTAIAAFFVLRTGRAQDAFLPGILWNAALTVLGLVSVVVRWPLVGFMVGAGDPRAADDPVAWRRDSGVVRVCQRLTLVMVAAFVVRVAVMAPLYLAGEVTWLGVAKVALGWPLWLAAVAVMAAMLLRGSTPQELSVAGSQAEGHSAPRGTR